MSDNIIDTIAAVLREYPDSRIVRNCDCDNCAQETAEVILAALQADRVALVKLPEPDADSNDDSWMDGTVHLTKSKQRKYPIVLEISPGDTLIADVGYARALAAALLAAADQAEAGK